MYKVKTFYFPLFLVYVVSPLVLIGGIYVMFSNSILGVLALVLSVVFSTTHYATTVDVEKKVYHDYLFLLGAKLNAESGKFQGIDKIVLTKGDYAYKASTRTSDRSVQFTDYSATLLFTGDQKLDLLTDTDKIDLLKKIKGLAEFLKIDIEDHSVSNPYVIDLSGI